MKKKIGYMILIFIAVISMSIIFPNKAKARTSYNSELEYEENEDGGITVYATSKSIQNIIIPSTIEGKNVTELGKDAFRRCTSLKSIEFPNTLEKIENYAFYECYELESINIPASVYKIGEYAFAYCKKIKNITIPYGVSTIDSGTFISCEILKTVNIPGSVTEIGYNAFCNCKSLEKISLKNVEDLGGSTFEGCSSLTSVGNINKLTDIPIDTFKDCTSLKSIILPQNISYIGQKAFYNTRLNRSCNTRKGKYNL